MRQRLGNRGIGSTELFNAKASLSPGAAGATTTVLTGTLSSAFELPGGITALCISFLLGLCWVVLDESDIRLAQKSILFILNSLTIFSVAYGLNSAGAEAFGAQARGIGFDTGFFGAWRLFG
jgi:hypothetical protein